MAVIPPSLEYTSVLRKYSKMRLFISLLGLGAPSSWPSDPSDRKYC